MKTCLPFIALLFWTACSNPSSTPPAVPPQGDAQQALVRPPKTDSLYFNDIPIEMDSADQDTIRTLRGLREFARNYPDGFGPLNRRTVKRFFKLPKRLTSGRGEVGIIKISQVAGTNSYQIVTLRGKTQGDILKLYVVMDRNQRQTDLLVFREGGYTTKGFLPVGVASVYWDSLDQVKGVMYWRYDTLHPPDIAMHDMQTLVDSTQWRITPAGKFEEVAF